MLETTRETNLPELRGKHGDQRERDRERRQVREGDREDQLAENECREARDEQERNDRRKARDRGRNDRARDLRRTDVSAFLGVQTILLSSPEDVLEHHDRV